MNKPKIYLVEWADAYGDSGWTTKEKAMELKPYLVTSIGWVLKDGAEHLILCSDIAKDGEGVAGVAVIPRDWVRNIYELIS